MHTSLLRPVRLAAVCLVQMSGVVRSFGLVLSKRTSFGQSTPLELQAVKSVQADLNEIRSLTRHSVKMPTKDLFEKDLVWLSFCAHGGGKSEGFNAHSNLSGCHCWSQPDVEKSVGTAHQLLAFPFSDPILRRYTRSSWFRTFSVVGSLTLACVLQPWFLFSSSEAGVTWHDGLCSADLVRFK